MGAAVPFVMIVAVWASFLGTAWACRQWRFRRPASIVALICCYAVLSVLALAWLGWTWNGLFGTFGMLFPFTIATTFVVGSEAKL